MSERPIVGDRGQVLARGQGRVLSPPRFILNKSRRAIPQSWAVIALVAVLPMFAQCFQYMTDVPPLYLLSKAWPLLMLPIAVWAFVVCDIPHKTIHLAALLWLLIVTPLVGIMQLGNDISGAVATTVKVWSFSYMFSLAGVLVLVRAGPQLVSRVFMYLGVGTFGIMLLLWIVVPASHYGGGDLETKLFMIDEERGYRIYMPMFFGVMLMFALNRSMWMRFAVWKPVVLLICFVLMLSIYKQRAAIGGAVLALGFGSISSLKRGRWVATSVLVLAVAVVALVMIERAPTTTLKAGLGNSLAVREVSVATAWNYLKLDPSRWIFGVGGTSRVGEVTLGKLFNNPMFFLADIGWLGVLFEYGAIGVILILSLYTVGLACAIRWARSGNTLSQACADYIVYLIACSPVYPAVFTPGELMTTMAVSYYLMKARITREVSPQRYIPADPYRGKVLWPAPVRSDYQAGHP